MSVEQLRSDLAILVAQRPRNYRTRARKLTAAILALESKDDK